LKANKENKQVDATLMHHHQTYFFLILCSINVSLSGGGKRGWLVYTSLSWMMDEPFIVYFFCCYFQPKSEFMASTLVASPLWHHPLSYQVPYLLSEIDCKHFRHQMGSVSELFCTT
jgi:hypothetical protein